MNNDSQIYMEMCEMLSKQYLIIYICASYISTWVTYCVCNICTHCNMQSAKIFMCCIWAISQNWLSDNKSSSPITQVYASITCGNNVCLKNRKTQPICHGDGHAIIGTNTMNILQHALSMGRCILNAHSKGWVTVAGTGHRECTWAF